MMISARSGSAFVMAKGVMALFLIVSCIMGQVSSFSTTPHHLFNPTSKTTMPFRYSQLYMDRPCPTRRRLRRRHPLHVLTKPSWRHYSAPSNNNSLHHHDDDAGQTTTTQLSSSCSSSSSKWPRIMTAIISIAAVACLPMAAHAAISTDHHHGGGLTLLASSIMAGGGGATELASSTSTWVKSLSETGFYQAFSLVFVSEIGDKTFFMAGLLAIQTSKVTSFLGSMAALAIMTLISVLIGQVFHAVPSGLSQGIPIDDVAAVLAFAFFGIKTLKDAIAMGESSVMEEELEEAEETVDESNVSKSTTKWAQLLSIFGLVFAAEFGDRSFLSTIALSAAQNPLSVAGGAIAAHAIATGIAVSGGSYVAKYVSEKAIGIIGGTLFLVFAVTTAIGIF
jgi:putative Ca2+/H+ antiporter (TMEM165/GDT1 family)